jgi:hypothetical protein
MKTPIPVAFILTALTALFSASLCHAQSYTIATAAGGGAARGTDGLGDGGPAVKALLSGDDESLAVDASGNLYIADTGDMRIRMVSTNGIITTVAGGVLSVSSGIPATHAFLIAPAAAAADTAGDIFIGINMGRGASDQILKVTPDGMLALFAGGGPFSLTNIGDGGPATAPFLAISMVHETKYKNNREKPSDDQVMNGSAYMGIT